MGAIRGIYCMEMAMRSSSGEFRTTCKSYCHAIEDGHGRVHIQRLDSDMRPVGGKSFMVRDEFLERYVRAGDPRGGDTEAIDVGPSGSSAVFDETRAIEAFDRGRAAFARGDRPGCERLARKAVSGPGRITADHKHVFNSFGLWLRRSGMPDIAADSYRRAIEAEGGDENLLFNLARAQADAGAVAEAIVSLRQCLKLNPEFDHASMFLAHLETKSEGLG